MNRRSTFTSSARPTLQWKAGSTVKVSSLGLSTAAKTLGLNLKKGGVRVSGSCKLNAARTSISVGKSGSCSVVIQTTQKAKPKLAGLPLNATAVVKQKVPPAKSGRELTGALGGT